MQQGCTILNTQQAYDVAHDVVVRAMAGLYFLYFWPMMSGLVPGRGCYFFILLAYDVRTSDWAGLSNLSNAITDWDCLVLI